MHVKIGWIAFILNQQLDQNDRESLQKPFGNTITGNSGHIKPQIQTGWKEKKAISINTHANTSKTVSIIYDYIKADQNNDLHKWLPEPLFTEKKKIWSKRETVHVRFELFFAHRTTVMRGKQRVLIQTTI